MTSVSGRGTNPRTVLLTRIVKFMLGPSDSVAHLEVVICRTQVLIQLIGTFVLTKKLPDAGSCFENDNHSKYFYDR